MSGYELLQQGLKNLDREEARKYYNAYKQWGMSEHKSPVDAIFDLIEKSEETIYKIKIIRKDTDTQYKKKIYESFNKYIKYGKDFHKRFHNIKHYNNLETYVEHYKMITGKWIKIDIPEEFREN